MTFVIGANASVNISGSVPNVNDSLQGWMQPLQIMVVQRSVSGYQENEQGTLISFQGVMQPFTDTQLILKPEGERAWSWWWLHADPSLALAVSDVVVYQTVQLRVMSFKNFSSYGFLEYHLIQDFTASGPLQLVGV